MKPVLKGPGAKRLKVTCDKLLSKFALNFNLRRYTPQPHKYLLNICYTVNAPPCVAQLASVVGPYNRSFSAQLFKLSCP